MCIKEWVVGQVSKINFGDIFIIEGSTGEHYTYNEFFENILMFEQNALFCNEKRKIIAVLDNSLQLLALYFYCMLRDMAIIPIDPQKGLEEINQLVSENQEDSIIIRKAEDLYFGKNNLDFQNKKNRDIKQDVIKKLLNRDFQKDYLITFTSGTSGNTKGVRHSLADLFSTSKAFNEIHRTESKRVFGHFFPMTYMAGILNSIIKPFILGCKIVVFERFSVKLALNFWNQMEKYQVSFFWTSPMMLNMILKTDRGEKGSKFCEKYNPLIFVGTAPLTDTLKKQFEEKYKTKVYVSYGLTELLFLSVEDEDTHDRYSGSVGKILPGVEFMHGYQEALVKTPWDFLGYTNEDTKMYYQNYFYKTGDVVEIREGILFIIGRKKELIIKGGLNISPVMIEEEVLKLPYIKDAAIWGESRENDEIIVCAYVTVSNEEDIFIQKKINIKIRESLGINYNIDKFFRVESIYYNINGKKDIKRMKEEYGGN